MKPLQRLTQKDVEWCWDKVEDKAFTEVKQLVTQALLFLPTIAHTKSLSYSVMPADGGLEQL